MASTVATVEVAIAIAVTTVGHRRRHPLQMRQMGIDLQVAVAGTMAAATAAGSLGCNLGTAAIAVARDSRRIEASLCHTVDHITATDFASHTSLRIAFSFEFHGPLFHTLVTNLAAFHS